MWARGQANNLFDVIETESERVICDPEKRKVHVARLCGIALHRRGFGATRRCGLVPA
jgi:hypothetical protein